MTVGWAALQQCHCLPCGKALQAVCADLVSQQAGMFVAAGSVFVAAGSVFVAAGSVS
jgi:hypothetical protein